MTRFYFYGTVIYPAKNPNDIPNSSLGLHYIDGEKKQEEEIKQKCQREHDKQNLHLVDMFGKSKRASFKWYGEVSVG